MTSSPNNIIIVNGAAASGKSWVCKQLSPTQYSYVSFDETRTKDLIDKLKACSPDIPVVVDLHNGVSTFAKRQKDEFASIKIVCIVEDEATIRERMYKRGGTFTVHTAKRMKRVETLRKRPDCIFSGTAEEVLAFLNGGCKSEEV
jgi:dephospho-CoA kinase